MAQFRMSQEYTTSRSDTCGNCSTNQKPENVGNSVEDSQYKQVWGVALLVYPLSLRAFSWTVCREMCGNHKGVTDGRTDWRTNGRTDYPFPIDPIP